jgi:hypothetical protein
VDAPHHARSHHQFWPEEAEPSPLSAFEDPQVLQARLHAAMNSLEKAIGETEHCPERIAEFKPSTAPSPLSTTTQ